MTDPVVPFCHAEGNKNRMCLHSVVGEAKTIMENFVGLPLIEQHF